MYRSQNQRPARIPVGEGLLAMAVGQLTHLLLIYRYRQPAPTLAMYRSQNQRPARIPVGEGLLAMAVGQLTHLSLIYRYRRQASSHSGHVAPTKSAPGPDPCGSGLAREGGVSVTESITEPLLSQASQLHTLVLCSLS